jgi:hypothetical protein
MIFYTPWLDDDLYYNVFKQNKYKPLMKQIYSNIKHIPS